MQTRFLIWRDSDAISETVGTNEDLFEKDQADYDGSQ
jgi:hypothetical protein